MKTAILFAQGRFFNAKVLLVTSAAKVEYTTVIFRGLTSKKIVI